MTPMEVTTMIGDYVEYPVLFLVAFMIGFFGTTMLVSLWRKFNGR